MNIAAMLVLQIVLIGFALLLVVLTMKKAKRAKQAQDRLVQTLTDGDASGNWSRINVTRPGHFAKKLKLLGFEARGLLINAPREIKIMAELPTGERLDRSILKEFPLNY